MEVAASHHQLVADPEPPAADGPAVGIELLAQGVVERIDSKLTSVHGREHLDVANRVQSVMRGEPLADQRDDLVQRGARVGPVDQEQVAPHPLPDRETRRPAAANRVSPLDDHAPRGLAEDVLEADRGDRAGRDQLGERLTRAHRRELIGIAHQHHMRPWTDGPQQGHHQLQVRHRRLVDDQQITGKRILGIVGGAFARDPAKRRVHRPGADPAGLAHPDRGPAGGCDEDHSRALPGRRRRDRADRSGLPCSRATRHEREAVAEGVAEPA